MTTNDQGTPAPSDGEHGDGWVVARVGPAGFRTEISVRSHTFIADEPLALGTDTGPTPYDYLLGALSACTAMTLRVYADRKQWPLEGVDVRMRTSRVHQPDCENCANTAVGITNIERHIDFVGPLTDEQRQRLLAIADRCPVKQTLERGIAITSVSSSTAT